MSYRLGVALSGGGSRGVAHAGVLQALADHGLVADCIAGSSSGALIGAFYAAGCSSGQILEFFRTKSPFKLSMLAVAKPGIIDSAKVRGDLLEYLPAEDTFESLQRKLFVTATDIVHGKAVIFQSGPLISAILASSSVPGIFTPTEIDGRWYSDGGIMNNFPVEPLHGLCDVVAGVYASPVQSVPPTALTTSLAVVQRALQVGTYSASKARFHQCDVLICPPGLTDYGLVDTKHVREIYDIGYQAGLTHLEAVRQALKEMDSVP